MESSKETQFLTFFVIATIHIIFFFYSIKLKNTDNGYKTTTKRNKPPILLG